VQLLDLLYELFKPFSHRFFNLGIEEIWIRENIIMNTYKIKLYYFRENEAFAISFNVLVGEILNSWY